MHARIKLRIKELENKELKSEIIETTVGRALFSRIIPDGIPFAEINKAMDSKAISKLINKTYRECWPKGSCHFC